MDNNNLKARLLDKGISNIGVYLRKSRDEKGNLDVLSNHRDDIIRFFEGTSVNITFYEEIGSSESFRQRDEINKLINDIEDNKYQAIAVIEAGRLTKSLGDYENLKNILRNNRTYLIITNNNRILDLRDSMDEQSLMFDIFSKSLHQKYTKELLIKGRIRSAKEGNWVSCTTPLGFEYIREKEASDFKKLRVLESEAVIVREMFRLYVDERQSTRSISELLMKQGVVNRKGKNIGHTVIYKMLKNLAYKGTSANCLTEVVRRKGKDVKQAQPEDKWIIIENAWKPLIPVETFDKAQEILEDKSVKTNRKYDNKAYYRGKITCAKCGSNVHIRNGKDPKYINSKRRISIEKCDCGYRGATLTDTRTTEGIDGILSRVLMAQAKILSDSIFDFYKELESGNKLIDNEVKSQTKATMKRISKIDSMLDKMLDGFECGLYNAVDIKERKEKHDNEKAMLQKELQRLKNKSMSIFDVLTIDMLKWTFKDNVINLLKNWMHLSYNVKRILLDLLVTQIKYVNTTPADAPLGGREGSYELHVTYRELGDIATDKESLRVIGEIIIN